MMFRRRFYFVTYIMALVTSSLVVDGFPRPVEFISEVGNYLSKRLRRNAVNFHRAIRCHQPDIMILGTYGSYGCFCGFSGYGQPIDETDKCCQTHDECYEEAGNVEKTLWESIVSYGGKILQEYESECRDGEVICAKNSPYREKLCSCDKEAALCFHMASATYHPQLLGIDTNKYCKVNASLEDLNLTLHYENRYHTNPQVTTTSLYEEKTTAENKTYIQTTPQSKADEKLIIPELVDPEKPPYIPKINPTAAKPNHNDSNVEVLEPYKDEKHAFHSHNHAASNEKKDQEEPDFDVETVLLKTDHKDPQGRRISFPNGTVEIQGQLFENQEALKSGEAPSNPQRLSSQDSVLNVPGDNSGNSWFQINLCLWICCCTFSLWLTY